MMAARQERPPRERRAPPPLDEAKLRELALAYVARFATTQGKLVQYLKRKLRERGWSDGAPSPDLPALAARLAELGYVDDLAFGQARAGALSRRGFGASRVGLALSASGLDRDTSQSLAAVANPREAAEAFARRRRFGPHDPQPFDPDRHRKQFGAMLRAGHPPAVVRAVLAGEVDDG